MTLTLANTGQLIHPGIMYGLCQSREADTFAAVDIPLFYQGAHLFRQGRLFDDENRDHRGLQGEPVEGYRPAEGSRGHPVFQFGIVHQDQFPRL